MDKYAVFGNPIAQSLSPDIHRLFAKQTQQLIAYDKILAPLDGFKSAVDAFFQSGGKGANVTVPFKLEAYGLCDELSASARQSDAVNTLLCRDDGKIEGHNTDGIGLIHDIEGTYQLSLRDKRVLIIGAGGAVHGIIPALMAAGVHTLDVANRTLEKAQALADRFSQLGAIHAYGLDILQGNYDVVIHATSVREASQLTLSDELLHPDAFYYDLNYQLHGQTPFVQWALEHGCRQVGDGLGMLIEQAAEAFRLWRGVRPDTHLIRSLIVVG